MPSTEEYEAALQDLVTKIENIGGDIQDQISGETDQGIPISGYVFEYNGRIFKIAGAPNREWFDLRFSYQADRDRAVNYELQTQSVRPDQVELSQGQIENATKEIAQEIKDFDEQTRQRFRSDVLDILTRDAMEYELSTGEEIGVIFGFSVGTKVWYYRDDFRAKELGIACQKVLNAGIRAMDLFEVKYDLVKKSNTTRDTQQNSSVHRGFQ